MMRLRHLALALATPFLVAQEAQKPKKKGTFNAGAWNSAVGLGGGAGGRYGMRGRGSRAYGPEVEAALNWLKSQQTAAGCWQAGKSTDATVAVTGTVMLAMLGNGSTMRSGPYKEQIKRAVNWLRRQQQPSGAFADATGPHLIASYAMAEAYVLSNYKLLKKCVVTASNFAESRRAADGGWRATEDAQNSDPALTMWGTCLLGTCAFDGIREAVDPRNKLLAWVTSARATVAPENGVLGARPPMARIGELAFDQSAANAWTIAWLDTEDEENELVTKALTKRDDALARARGLTRKWQKDPKLKLSMTEWYASSHAFAQARDPASLTKMCKALVAAQVKKGEHAGTWEPLGVWGEAGGRAWTTAMATMTLCAQTRYTAFDRR